MSAIIYDHSQLATALLPAAMSGSSAEKNQQRSNSSGEGLGAGAAAGRREELALNSSSPGLDSSRRSMNRSEGLESQEGKELVFSGRGVVVELSRTVSQGSTKKSHPTSFDSVDNSDDEDESDEDEQNGHVPSQSASQNQLIVNDRQSFEDSTLPRLYNPGTRCLSAVDQLTVCNCLFTVSMLPYHNCAVLS